MARGADKKGVHQCSSLHRLASSPISSRAGRSSAGLLAGGLAAGAGLLAACRRPRPLHRRPPPRPLHPCRRHRANQPRRRPPLRQLQRRRLAGSREAGRQDARGRPTPGCADPGSVQRGRPVQLHHPVVAVRQVARCRRRRQSRGRPAAEYTVSPDARTFTFKLRDGIKFTDGTALNAEVLKAHLTRAADPALAKISNARFTTLQSIDVTDASSVKLTFTDPKPLLPFSLAAFWTPASFRLRRSRSSARLTSARIPSVRARSCSTAGPRARR